ncbi:MAG: hypothetical protein KDD77_12050 [Caldilineaceae bacterium]|nr:hypothetical protein [Caldilineaceae bacterium]
MAQRRSPRSLRRLDLSKYAVLLVAALALIVLLLTRSYQQQAIAPPEPDATLVATFTAEAELARPVLISPMTGATIEPGAITLSGEGARGHSVRIRSGASLLASAPVDADGQWSATVRIDEPGAHSLTLEQVDPAGAIVAAGDPLALSVGVPAQIAAAPSLDAALAASDLAAGPLRLAGTGEPGSTIQIVVDDAVLTESTVDETGEWEVTLRVNTPGLYAVGLRSLDADGQIAATATPAVLRIAPAAQPVQAVAPTDTPTPPAASAQTTIDSVIVNTDPGASRIAASGMGIPGVEVQLVLDGTAVSTTTVSESGNWSLIATLDQPDAYAVAVRSVDPATGAVTDVPVPAQRMIIALPTPTPTATATPEIDATATPTPVPTAPFAVTGYEFDNESGVVALQGSGAPAGLVRLLLDSTAVATGTIDLDGRWARRVITRCKWRA